MKINILYIDVILALLLARQTENGSKMNIFVPLRDHQKQPGFIKKYNVYFTHQPSVPASMS